MLKRGSSATQASDSPAAGAAGRPKTVFVAGAPAVGKGTQCERIIEAYGLVHISPGNILRDHVRRDTDVGKLAAKAMNEGHLVPSDLVIKVVKERMACHDVENRGCLLDNFPLTAEQAEAMRGEIHADVFLYLEASQEALENRAQGRLVDPLTGGIYHSEYKPPPKGVEARLEQDNGGTSLIMARLKTYRKHIDAILPYFEGCIKKIDANRAPDEVFAKIKAVLDKHGWGPTEDAPYVGSKAFGGPFNAEEAQKAGFYSPDSPPEVGDRVVCFQRGPNFRREGVVVTLQEKVSDGQNGLKQGVTGLLIEVSRDQDGSPSPTSMCSHQSPNRTRAFSAWSVFLAPCNDMEYSSLSTTAKFQASHYCRISHVVGGVQSVSMADARRSLIDWLQNLTDSDNELIEVSEVTQEKILEAFDTKESPSLYCYSTNVKLTSRTQLVLGRDFSLYYRALNNTLNNDNEEGLHRAMPLIQHMVYDLLYDASGSKRRHKGGQLYKGDIQRPVPLNMQKLREAAAMGTVVRFRQFQSTTSDRKLAAKYQKREDGRGFMWEIDVPEDHWGARDIQDVAWRAGESETLFPPYAAFLVQAISDKSCHLQAVDFSSELEERAKRHKLHMELTPGLVDFEFDAHGAIKFSA